MEWEFLYENLNLQFFVLVTLEEVFFESLMNRVKSCNSQSSKKSNRDLGNFHVNLYNFIISSKKLFDISHNSQLVARLIVLKMFFSFIFGDIKNNEAQRKITRIT